MPVANFHIKNNKTRNFTFLALTLLSLTGCYFIAYQTLRHETAQLLTWYVLLFACYLFSFYLVESKKEVLYFLGLALAVRLILLPSIPPLSDDFYRFLWDGMLINQGIHPFSQVPAELVKTQGLGAFPAVAGELYQYMNSPDYFTIYPPVCQAIFTIASFLFPNSVLGGVITIRVFIFLSEIGSIILLWKLLERYHLPAKNILLYALNPLIAIEFTGNLHFEAFMILFLLASVYLFHQKKLVWAGVLFGFAICSKLIPLIFLPLYLRNGKFKQIAIFYVATGLTTILLFLPLLTTELINGLDSITLYFQKFEFNASAYYILRAIGYYRKGYNVIATAGKQLAAATFISIVVFSVLNRNKRILISFLWILFIYLIFATTVHPWYIIPLIAFSTFSDYRFPVIWSALIFLTYAGYTQVGFSENMAFVVLEYCVVFGFSAFEIRKYFANHTI